MTAGLDVSELPDLHRRALAATGAVVAAIDADRWHDPTPCEDWDVRELVNHVVAGNLWASALGAGATIESVGDRFDGDVLGENPPDSYGRSADLAAATFGAPGALAAPCAVSYGPVPGSVYCGHRLLDVLVHGWDLATATGQSADLDAELVRACLDLVEAQAEMLAESGMFGTRHRVPDDASDQDRLLAMLGRRPRPA